MSRADEIAQGLRDEGGALIGGLDVLECVKAQEDFEAGRPPPRMTSTSYDVWRARCGRIADEKAEVLRKINAEQAASTERVRQMLLEMGRPDVLAEMDANLARIRAK